MNEYWVCQTRFEEKTKSLSVQTQIFDDRYTRKLNIEMYYVTDGVMATTETFW